MLTKEHIKALKQATTICLRFADGVHTIEPSKKVKDGVYGEHEVRATIEVDGYVTDYGKNAKDSPIIKAWAYFGSCKFMPELQSVIGLLRAGDSVSLQWVANNDSETLNNAGFCNDSVSIRITRPTKGKQPKIMQFLVDEQVSPIGSTARMCQR